MKEKVKIGILLGVEFLAVAVILVLVFLAGKKSYTVTFDLNGGTLISGDLEQRVTQGHDANPPQATKEGHYFLRWSGNYKEITRDLTLKAIWEYETTPGIVYSDSQNANFCEIIDSYSDLRGEVYIGAYHDEKKVLGIKEGAFSNRTGITGVYLLDGIIHIENNAFKGCTGMITVDIPSTTVRVGEFAFADRTSLTDLVLPEGLEVIGAYAFSGCSSLERIVIPESVKTIHAGAFEGCTSLTEVVIPAGVEIIESGAFDNATTLFNISIEEENAPTTWADGWHANGATLVWGYVEKLPEEETEDSDDKATNK